MKLKLRNNKGITLVALVVTIVVLLILAGISLSLVLGENGIIAKAKEAKNKSVEDASNTDVALSDLYDEMEEAIGELNKDDWYETDNTIDLTGITEYHVTNCKELKMLANTVNAGNNFEGITVYLDKNLDLQGNKEKQWTPIGVNDTTTFNGNFNGQNHCISGIYINDDELDYVGLFGSIDGNAYIQNLGIIKGYICTNSGSAGGIAGCTGDSSEDLTVKNCYNMSEVSGYFAGGIVGYNYGTIENCYNEGKISSLANDPYASAGGIAGHTSLCTIKTCYNKGEVISEAGYAGGISGWDEEGILNIENCYNLGQVSGEYAGGISANIGLGGIMSGCYNLGVIEGTTKGEIVGMAYGDETDSTGISNCYFLLTSTNDENDENVGIGENDGATVTNVDGKTEVEMKASDFITLLNNGGTAWKLDENNINNGYPILSWQK